MLIKDLLGQERTKKGIIRVEIRKAFESTKKEPIKFLINIEAMFNSYPLIKAPMGKHCRFL